MAELDEGREEGPEVVVRGRRDERRGWGGERGVAPSAVAVAHDDDCSVAGA